MKATRDHLAASLRVLIEWTHETCAEINQGEVPSSTISTDGVEAAFYNLCEAERAYEAWMQEVVEAARPLAEHLASRMIDPGKIRGQGARLARALEGTEPVRLPDVKRGPYR